MSRHWKFEVFYWNKESGDRVLMKSMRPDEPAEFKVNPLGTKIYRLCEITPFGNAAHILENRLGPLGSMTISECESWNDGESDSDWSDRMAGEYDPVTDTVYPKHGSTGGW